MASPPSIAEALIGDVILRNLWVSISTYGQEEKGQESLMVGEERESLSFSQRIEKYWI